MRRYLPVAMCAAMAAGCHPNLDSLTAALEGRTFRAEEYGAAFYVEKDPRTELDDVVRRIKMCDWDDGIGDYGGLYGTLDPDAKQIILDDVPGIPLNVELHARGPTLWIGHPADRIGTEYDEVLNWERATEEAPFGFCGPVCPRTKRHEHLDSFDPPEAMDAAACHDYCTTGWSQWGDCMVVPGAVCSCSQED
jgi:hypothetical protein